MSTGAVLGLAAIVVLFVGAVALVIGSVVSLYRRGRRLVHELDGLQRDVEQALGSAQSGLGNGPGGSRLQRHGDGSPG